MLAGSALLLVAVAGGIWVVTRPAPPGEEVSEMDPLGVDAASTAGADASAPAAGGAVDTPATPPPNANTPRTNSAAAPPASVAGVASDKAPTSGRAAPALAPAKEAATATPDGLSSKTNGTKPAAPTSTSADAAAADRLKIARAKADSNLLEPALADLGQIRREFPASAAAADASFLSADILERLGRIEDAMAVHVEFHQRFASHPRIAASKLRLAELTLKSRQPNKETIAREMLKDVADSAPRSNEALAALRLKLTLEQGRARERDPVLGIEVPRALPTLRTLTEQFPTSPLVMAEWSRLAAMYADLDQHEHAATAYWSLATYFPANPYDAWYRAGEIFERRLKDMDKAREAYANVPQSSPRYRDAQRKLK